MKTKFQIQKEINWLSVRLKTKLNMAKEIYIYLPGSLPLSIDGKDIENLKLQIGLLEWVLEDK